MKIDSRECMIEQIAELEENIRAEQQELNRLKRELIDYDYLAYWNKVTSGPIEWEKMCWPLEGSGALREVHKCIVCKEGFKKYHGNHMSGCHMGSGFRHPYVDVHVACVPEWVLKMRG